MLRETSRGESDNEDNPRERIISGIFQHLGPHMIPAAKTVDQMQDETKALQGRLQAQQAMTMPSAARIDDIAGEEKLNAMIHTQLTTSQEK